MPLAGTCHCGAVTVEVAAKPRSITECNCSICYRYGARWAHYTRATARIACAPDAVAAYLWGDRTIEFYHCNSCGCVTHYESVEKLPDSRISVNVRIMPPAEIAEVPVRKFDGADTWTFLQE